MTLLSDFGPENLGPPGPILPEKMIRVGNIGPLGHFELQSWFPSGLPEIIYRGIGNEATYHVLTRAIRT